MMQRIFFPDQNFNAFIISRLNSGYSYDAISVALRRKKVPKSEINKYFKELKLKNYAPKIRFKEPVKVSVPENLRQQSFDALSKYVTKQLSDGFKLKDIKQVLLNYGHSVDIVDDVIKSKK